jgi:putative intracellular protease/amidase
MKRAVHLMVVDGMADWEAALAIAELRRTGGHDVVTVGFGRDMVTTMGGLRVAPDLDLSDFVPRNAGLLIVPGGDLWEAGQYPRPAFERALRDTAAAQVPLAAICGGTVALARAGLYQGRRHTSNDRDWLLGVVPGYAGHELYRDDVAVRDNKVITASASGSVEFAGEIFAELGMLPAAQRTIWFTLFKTGRFPPGTSYADMAGGG